MEDGKQEVMEEARQDDECHGGVESEWGKRHGE
jgi:hypothetical protein